MTIVELENNRYDFLCCGFAAGIRNHHDQTQVDIETKKRSTRF
jgi:Fe-S oxidoreductase